MTERRFERQIGQIFYKNALHWGEPKMIHVSDGSIDSVAK